MKIGRPVFRAMADARPDYISSDCPIAGRHIEQGIERAGRRHARARSIRSRCCAWPTDSTCTMTPCTPGKITRDSLMTLETYAKERPHFRARVLEHKRSAHRAPGRARHAHVRGRAHDALPDPGDAAHREDVRGGGIQDELDAYNPLVPDGANFKATMLIEYEDVDERQRRARAAARHRGPRVGAGRRACQRSTRSPTRTSSARPRRRRRRCISCASSSRRRWRRR